MKQLTRIRLVNWHLFTDVTITCQGTTCFIGINGAGKSTILDAVQFALVGGQRDVKFNQAALANSRRTVSSYARGELGTEGQRYLRGDCSGLVALEFANSDGTCFAHGALVDAYADNHSPDIAYFIVHNYLLDEAPVDVKTLKDQLETLRHFEKLVAGIVARIAELERVETLDAERLANRRRRITNGFIRREAEADALLTDLKQRRLERDEADLSLKRAELARDGLTESLQSAQEALL
jgi:hypothetical protein